MPEEAVLDAPVDTAPADAEPVSTDTETPTSDDQSQTPESPETPAADGSKPEPLVTNGKFSEETRKFLDDLKRTNPRLANNLRNALLRDEANRKAAPGGIREIQELRQTLQEYGGKQALANLKQSASELESVNALLAEGNAALLERVPSESLAKLLPNAYNRFAEENPEGFTAMVSRTFANHALESNVPESLIELRYLAANNEALKPVYEKLRGFFDGISQWAKQPIQKKVEPAPKNEALEKVQALEQRLQYSEWGGQAQQIHANIYQSELKKLTTGRNLTAEQTANIHGKYLARMNQAADQTFKSAVDAYAKSGDREGYTKYIQQWYNQKTGAILRSIVEKELPPVKTKAPVNTPPKPAAPAANGRTGQPDFVPKAPQSSEIDFSRTPGDMIKKNQATLKDGRKVYWQ